jgi:fibronectin type 3 domain-containing protein
MGATTYHFISWSDGGNQSHLITGTASTTYTATYSLTADTGIPTVPSSLIAGAVSGTQINLSWPAATDNVGVTGYQVERCQGVGCTTFALIASPTTTSYVDTGLTAGTSYSYRIRARDAVGNLSGDSSIATVTTATATPTTRRELINDAFTRANSTNLGTLFDPGHTGTSAMQIVSNAARGSVPFAIHMESNNSVTWPNNQWSQITVSTYTNQFSGGGPACRMGTPPTANGYWVDTNGSDLYVIRRQSNAGATRIATSATHATSNDTVLLECVGSTITLSVNGTAVAAATDTTYASGRAGLMLYMGTSTANTILDNWSAGEYISTDTTPPTAPSSLTAGAVSGTQINLSWPAATDNVGVTGYQVERCQGAGCTTFALIASPTTTSYLDIGLTAGTTYRYRVSARDAVGNLSGDSNIVTVTISGGPVAGLVAAYGFNEGTGVTSSDASGNNNTASLNTATWTTQGRFGNALSFNGTSAKVTVPDAPSLDLTTGMTLEAWVYPTVTGGGSGWRSVFIKEQPGQLVYGLYSNIVTNKPSVDTNTGTYRTLVGGMTLAANTWAHLAATYNGATVRLYVNGVQVASQAQTGTLTNSTGVLSIGGNAVWPEWFTGRLDEIRIYNRALSVSEIQQDMTIPVGGP